MRRSLAPARTYAIALVSFAGLAVVLSAAGLYGLIAFLVNQRTHEFGIRLALGADPARLRVMVVRGTARIALPGLAIGAAAAALAAPALQSLLFGVAPLDGLTFAGTAALLIGVGAAAAYLPAKRATRVDPLTALRVD
jgi:putative ABC transport system permease protein